MGIGIVQCGVDDIRRYHTAPLIWGKVGLVGDWFDTSTMVTELLALSQGVDNE
jgi:hypothetical protein